MKVQIKVVIDTFQAKTKLKPYDITSKNNLIVFLIMHAWLLSCFFLLSVVDHLAKYLAMRLALESQQEETGE